ncbi:tyrosine phosphatase-like protein [Entophlyctis helioformis]|nr:tyrosine phosphatase-like protein [Entophlyctis helioformis]
MSSKSAKAPKPLSPLIQGWLVLYNIASLVGWGAVLVQLVQSLVETQGDFTESYAAVGPLVTIVQACAILEIFHTIIGAVKSSVAVTTMQVSSRLLLVAVCHYFAVPAVREHFAFSTMVIAWSVTEVIRYSYYGFNLVGLQPAILVWARYTFFFVLYPLGAGSELWLVINSLESAKAVSFALYALFGVIAAIYVPGFYVMYTHMIGQRRKYLGGGDKKGKKKTE